MVKDNQLYFVECLTKEMINLSVVSKKLALSKYANLWFVVPKGITLNIFPIGPVW